MYFITICTYKRECLFGDVVDGEMLLSEVGEIAEACWQQIPDHYPQVILDGYVVMPNHVHGIIEIAGTQGGDDANVVGANNHSPLQDTTCGTSRTIGAMIRGFKIGVTKRAQNEHNLYGVWQRNYYEHIIRNERELRAIQEYITYNPAQWEEDEYHPVQMARQEKARGGVMELVTAVRIPTSVGANNHSPLHRRHSVEGCVDGMSIRCRGGVPPPSLECHVGCGAGRAVSRGAGYRRRRCSFLSTATEKNQKNAAPDNPVPMYIGMPSFRIKKRGLRTL